MDVGKIQHIQKLLEANRSVLNDLELRAAMHGPLNTPSNITIESDRIRPIIAQLEVELRQYSLQQHYDDTSALRRDDKWQAVLDKMYQLNRLQPGYPDPEGLYNWALRREYEERICNQARNADTPDELSDAFSALRKLLNENPNNTIAQGLLKEIRDKRRSDKAGAIWKQFTVTTSDFLVYSLQRWRVTVPIFILLLISVILLPRLTSSAKPPAASASPTHQRPQATAVESIASPVPTLAAAPSEDERIAFVSNRSGSWEIYVMSIRDNSQMKISSRQATSATSPSWSHDAKQIAFVSKNEAGADQIYLMNADGNDIYSLTSVIGDAGVPTWSPNDKQIAFQVIDKNGDLAIFVIDLSDKQQFLLTENLAQAKYPAWSPIDQRIAFESNRDGNWELYVINADGSGSPQRLTNTPTDEHGPAWSPDGRRIAYVVEQDGRRDIYTMNADGSNQTNMTHAFLANPGVPSWSPDGQHIVFQAEVDNEWQLFIMKADGNELQQMTFRERDGINYFPAWSPRPH